jgi:uncharacterized membrane protein YfcA
MDYWTVYWFQGIACFVFASTATFSGVIGSALMFPWLVMGYALLPVPEITVYQAVAASILLETVAASIGLYRYYTRRLIDFAAVKVLGVWVQPAAILGALASHWAPARVIEATYSMLMLLVAWLLMKRVKVGQSDRPSSSTTEGKERCKTDSQSGETYRYRVGGLKRQRWVSAGGAFSEGLISAGTGEVSPESLLREVGHACRYYASGNTDQYV